MCVCACVDVYSYSIAYEFAGIDGFSFFFFFLSAHTYSEVTGSVGPSFDTISYYVLS